MKQFENNALILKYIEVLILRKLNNKMNTQYKC